MEETSKKTKAQTLCAMEKEFRSHGFKTIGPSGFFARLTVSEATSSLSHPLPVSRRSMQGKLLDHSIDNSFLGGRIGKKPFFEAAEKSQKLRHDDVYRQIVMLAKFIQSPVFDDLITASDG